MMIKLRERTAIVMWFVILAFVGLIVLEWGADFDGSAQVSSDAIGVINGEEISLRLFQSALRNVARQTSREARSDEGKLIRDVWDQLVGEALVRQELSRLGLTVSDKELAYYTRVQPPEAVKSIEAFQVDGEFDPSVYNQFLNDRNTYDDPSSKTFVLQIEQLQRSQLLNFRLRQTFMESIQVTPTEVRQHYAQVSEKVSVDYVFSPAGGIADSTVAVTDADIDQYYSEHAEDYFHRDQIRLAYAFFPRAPTSADSARVRADIESLREDIVGGADFGQMAAAVSEDEGSAANAGDLGTFGRGAMVKPFDDVAFDLPIGGVSEPVQTRFGLHLIMVEDRVQEDGEDKIQARHILLKYKASPDTEEAIFERASAFVALANERGFNIAAQIEGVQVRTPGYIGRAGVIPGLGDGTTWVVNLFFDSEIGTVSRVGSVETGYWVAHALERREEGIAPLGEVRRRAEQGARQGKKAEAAKAPLQRIREQLLAGTDLGTAAQSAGLEVIATEPFSRSDYVPEVGRGNRFVGEAFRLLSGDLSEVITTNLGAYLMRLTDKQEVDESLFAVARPSIEQELQQQRQTEVLQLWLVDMYESADIVDNRHLFDYRF